MPRLTAKGQVTIPKRIRDYLGLKAGANVEFKLSGDGRIVLQAEPHVDAKTKAGPERQRMEKALAELRGSAKFGMTTDELMRITRGWGEPDYDVK